MAQTQPEEEPARDEQAAWEAIVADLRGQVDPGPPLTPQPAAFAEGRPPRTDPMIDELLSEGSFEPPEPPPIPRPPDAIARFAWAAAIGGPVLVVGANLLGMGLLWSTIGIAAFAAGFAFLIFRRPERSDDDDGAVV